MNSNSPLAGFNDWSLHKRILMLAIPMVLSNITVPLLGLVDAAVIGHLEHSYYLGGVALGGTMISMTFWLLGFLRMSTTGLTAQALGANHNRNLALVAVQGISMALLLATLFLIFHRFLLDLIFSLSDASEQVKYYGQQYFLIRAWSAPAALCNFVLLGWLLGTQNAKAPMWMVIIANVTNIVLDILFVVILDWKVEGAAYASVVADYVSACVGFIFLYQTWKIRKLEPFAQLLALKLSALFDGIGKFVALNRDIFLRSLCLQAVFAFMTFQGANFGDDVIAANAVLMSFLMMISYGLDGFAYAIEAMIGKAIGAKDRAELKLSLLGTFFWSFLVCLMLTLVFALGGNALIAVISDLENVQQNAAIYLPWLIAMPLVAMWCFLFDGVFIGATKGKEMRNSMFIATCGFFCLFWVFSEYQNHALWLSMLFFMGLRGITLAVVFLFQWKRSVFF